MIPRPDDQLLAGRLSEPHFQRGCHRSEHKQRPFRANVMRAGFFFLFFFSFSFYQGWTAL